MLQSHACVECLHVADPERGGDCIISSGWGCSCISYSPSYARAPRLYPPQMWKLLEPQMSCCLMQPLQRTPLATPASGKACTAGLNSCGGPQTDSLNVSQ
eukprot:1076592-Amphidinium_carterae.2